MGPSLSPQRAGELSAVELLHGHGHGDRDIAVANIEYANKLEEIIGPMTIPKTRKLYYDDVRKSVNTTSASRGIPSNRKEVGKPVKQIQSLLNNSNTCITSNICINSNRIFPEDLHFLISIRLKLPNIFFVEEGSPKTRS